MPLTKIQRLSLEKELDNIKNTYPKMKLIKPEEFGRLWKPDTFPYPNKNRLYREVSDKIIQSLLDFHYAFFKLPDSYKSEILLSPEFSTVMTNVFSAGQIEKLRIEEEYPKLPNEEPDNTFSTDLYQKFFNIGLEGLIKTMPQDFRPYLIEQIKPLMMLMLSISRFSKTAKSKERVPQLEFPAWLFDSNRSSLNSY